MEKFVIFSIDNVNDLHSLAKFTRYLDTRRSMGELRGNVIICTGSYKGQLETSFLMRRDDFDEHIRNSVYIANQESILRVSECNKQYATLEYLKDGRDEFIGSLKSVPKDEALMHDAWTYRPDINQYWVSVDGNPDTVHNITYTQEDVTFYV